MQIIEKIMMGILIFLGMWSLIHSDILFGFSKYKIALYLLLLGFFIKFVFLIIINQFLEITLLNIICSTILGYLTFCIYSPIYVNRFFKTKNNNEND